MKTIPGEHTKPIIDLRGERFGRLVVLALGPKRGRRLRWWARCDCGTERLFYGEALRGGITRSCGCKRRVDAEARRLARPTKQPNPKFHGLRKTRAYAHWRAAKQRCFDPNASNYRYYGGRGITMCEQWRADFGAFYRDLGECPPGYSLERDDFNGNYEPGNCRWATHVEQVKNTSRNIFVEHEGGRLCLKDYAKAVGVSYNGIRYRMKHCGESAYAAAARLLERRRSGDAGHASPQT